MRTTRLNKPKKDKVIRARCDAFTETLIFRAANALSLDVSDFIRIASTRYAHQITTQAAGPQVQPAALF